MKTIKTILTLALVVTASLVFASTPEDNKPVARTLEAPEFVWGEPEELPVDALPEFDYPEFVWGDVQEVVIAPELEYPAFSWGEPEVISDELN